MIRICFIIFLTFLASCNSSNKITESKIETDPNPRPEWATSRPINSSYYIGIGSANKLSFPSEYSIIAKKNALTDMSSEITVNISGESFYQTVDNNFNYSEEFQSMIRSSFKEEITDYEIVDSWENDNEFWIFTRISKAEHTRIKNLKKSKVLNQAYSNFILAEDYRKDGKIADALDLLSTSLLNMKEYWSEPNPYIADDKEIFLDNSIYSEIRSICANLEIIASENKFELNYLNGFSKTISVAIKHEDKYIPNIPILYKFTNNPYSRAKKLYTDADGVIAIGGENFDSKSKKFQLEIWIDYDELLHNQSSMEVSQMLVSSINKKMLNMPAIISLPSVYFKDAAAVNPLTESIKNELLKNGFTISTAENEAELDIYISHTLKDGGTAQGFQVALLDFNISIEDHGSKRQLFADSYTGIKGIQLNLTGAENEALKNASKKIKKEVIPKLMNLLF